MSNRIKCVVPSCKNEQWQGRFIGNLCAPCYLFYEVFYNLKEVSNFKCAAYKEQKEFVKQKLIEADKVVVEEKYNKG